jgi:hypothetical protein
MSKAGSIKTTVTLPEDVHWGFKKRAAELHLSDKDAITEALREWIARPVENPQPAPRRKLSGR